MAHTGEGPHGGAAAEPDAEEGLPRWAGWTLAVAGTGLFAGSLWLWAQYGVVLAIQDFMITCFG